MSGWVGGWVGGGWVGWCVCVCVCLGVCVCGVAEYPATKTFFFSRGRREFQRVLRQQRRSLLTRDIQPDQLDVPAIVMFVNVLLVPSLNRRCFCVSLLK